MERELANLYGVDEVRRERDDVCDDTDADDDHNDERDAAS